LRESRGSLAPYKNDESTNHQSLCRVLSERFEIALSLRDFATRHDVNGRKTCTIRPLAFAEVSGSTRLMVVNCHFVMIGRAKKSALRFDVDPESVASHLLAASGPSTRRSSTTTSAQRRCSDAHANAWAHATFKREEPKPNA
jgi:hypothetical protein